MSDYFGTYNDAVQKAQNGGSAPVQKPGQDFNLFAAAQLGHKDGTAKK